MKNKLEKYVRMQNRLSERISDKDELDLERIRHVAGVDITFKGNLAIAQAVLLSYPNLELLKEEYVVAPVEFPYIPTFLMFREGKPAVKALKKILLPHSVVFVDGSGICHPRRFGLACYIGLALSAPTIGITKKPLAGTFIPPEKEGEYSNIVLDGKIVGKALKTCRRCNPIYVSVGHKISLNSAVKLTFSTIKKGKLPEPVRIAHELLQELRRTDMFQP